MKIAVYATPFKSGKIARKAMDFLKEMIGKGLKIVLSESAYKAFEEQELKDEILPEIELTDAKCTPRETDVIISLGGDGTFLRAARWCGDSEIPIVGINLGHLGYLPSFSLDEMSSVPEILASGDYDIESRSLLKLEIPNHISDSINEFWPYALNEVAVLKQDTASMISIPVSIDSRELSIYRADGLIIATPTGSTGYNLSVGGPILQPTIPAWVLSPIADHSLTMRPMVISDNSVLDITASGRAEAFRVSVDGISFVLPGGTPLKITKAPFTCRIIIKKGKSFASTLRSKLLWGESLMIG